jgi:hypothetical protein
MTMFVAAAGAPQGWKWDRGSARADDGVPACDPAVATCDEPADDDPSGGDTDGWSWNRAEIVSLGSEVTLTADGSSVAVAAPDGAAPSLGDTVTVVVTDEDTLLGFPTADGGIAWTALGWSWN